MHGDRDARIRERAHQIWVDEGQVEGRDEEHWHRAEREITAEEASTTEAQPEPPAKPRKVGNAAKSATAAPPAPRKSRPSEKTEPATGARKKPTGRTRTNAS
jgi:hypothetical protein